MNTPSVAPLDVMAVLTLLQQQLSELTEVVEAQQRTLQRLLDGTGGAACTSSPAGRDVVCPGGP